MSDLPIVNQQPSGSSALSGSVTAPVGNMAKEAEPHVSFAEAPLLQEIGQEMPLPSEVAKAGVTIQPSSVKISPAVSQLGVKVVGAPTPVIKTATTITLPLSDEQIAQGLNQSIMSSWRWLAQWCERQLKRAHIMLKSVHGQVSRTTS